MSVVVTSPTPKMDKLSRLCALRRLVLEILEDADMALLDAKIRTATVEAVQEIG